MPLPIIAWGAIALGGLIFAGAVALFWEDIQKWAVAVLSSMKIVVKGLYTGSTEIYKKGFKYFKRVIVFGHKKEKGKYKKKEVEEEVDESDIPEEILEKIKAREEVKQELELELE